MYRLARIYGFQAAPGEAAVFLDRLYPRGIRKETMSQFVWLKDLTPSAGLRPSGRRRWKSCAASMPNIPPLCC